MNQDTGSEARAYGTSIPIHEWNQAQSPTCGADSTRSSITHRPGARHVHRVDVCIACGGTVCFDTYQGVCDFITQAKMR